MQIHQALPDLSFIQSDKSSAHWLSLDGRQTDTNVAAKPKEHAFIAARKERPRLPGTKAMIVARALGHMFGRSIHQVKSSFLSIPMPGI